MDEYLSKKIKFISFFSIIMVVFLHSYNLVVNIGDESFVQKNGFSSFIQDYISQGITRIAVPIFYIISGYLFFMKDNFNKEIYFTKLKKRFHSVLIPYLIWSVWGVFFICILQATPISSPFFTGVNNIKQFTIEKYLEVILVNPIPYQLWFLRDLMILIICTPLIYFFVKKIKFFYLISLIVIWFIDFNFVIISNESLLFFSTGVYLSMFDENILKNRFWNRSVLFIIVSWLLLVLVKSTLSILSYDIDIISFVLKTSIIFGVLSFWILYDYVFAKGIINKIRMNIVMMSFFIYVSHEPILTIIKKGLFFLLGKGELLSLIIYFIAPILTIFSVILIGIILQRCVPRLYVVITGGR